MAFDLATARPVEEDRPRFDLATATPVMDELQPQPPRSRSMPAQVARQVGLTARAGVEGVTALPQMLTDSLFRLYDLGAAGIEKVTGIPQTRYSRNQMRVRDALTNLGLPEPETATERVAGDVASGMAGSGGMVKLGQGLSNAGNALVRRIGEVLSTSPELQIAAGATGPGAASVTREAGGGTGAQLAAGFAGAALPSASTGIAEAVRRTVRGGESGRQRVAQNIETFEKAGAGTPTVGQATESRANRAVESVLAKTPGAAGRLAAKAESEAAGLGTKVDDMATSLAGRTGAAPAGRQIRTGLEQFVDDFKASSGSLYDKLDKHIPRDSAVQITNTRAALKKLNANIPGAPQELSDLFKNAKIEGIEKSLASGNLPYEAVKRLRTLVGEQIAEGPLVSGAATGKWKALYGALSKDMAAAARAASPDAEASFVRANNFYSAGMKRIEDVLTPIVKKGDPEDIFQAAVAGTKEGASTISGVMKSLPTESRKVVATTMLRRLGLATPGKQNELGEVFSAETFLTNWNRISPDSKRVLFATLPDSHRADLDKIAKVAANIRDGSKIFANPSGTGQVVAATTGWTAFGVLLATGQIGGAGAVAAGAGLANAQARLMTNPKFVHWLAGSTKAPAEQLPAQLNQLFQQSLYMKGEERREVRDFIKQAREAAAIQRRGEAQ